MFFFLSLALSRSFFYNILIVVVAVVMARLRKETYLMYDMKNELKCFNVYLISGVCHIYVRTAPASTNLNRKSMDEIEKRVCYFLLEKYWAKKV